MQNKQKLKYLALLAALAIAAFQTYRGVPPDNSDAPPVASQPVERADDDSDSLLARAFDERRSNLQVEGSGVVSRVLPDDNKGSRHQRLLVTLQTGQTVLIAHNIDLAPRISDVKAGDRVRFYGEYEWNDKGGVIHWTHHDPEGRHPHGWLEHNGRRYQ